MAYLVTLSRPASQRFWEKVCVGESCWLWMGAKDLAQGYGYFGDGTKVVRAHRWAYEQLIGPIPVGLEIDHLCRVTACVNPEHLEAVTRSTNIQRGRTSALRNQTQCCRGHEFSPENTRHYMSGGYWKRGCRTCFREYDREWKRRRRHP